MKNVCQINEYECPCKKEGCPNHGNCCACVANHKKVGNVPFCLKENVEKMIEAAK